MLLLLRLLGGRGGGGGGRMTVTLPNLMEALGIQNMRHLFELLKSCKSNKDLQSKAVSEFEKFLTFDTT